jgi:hypothetical protein
MSILIMVALCALAGYLGCLVGRRWERGRIELEERAHEEQAYARSVRSGHVRMSTMKIRR